jgi:hypothetical protein
LYAPVKTAGMTLLILGLDSLDADRVRHRYEFPELRLAESAKVDLEGLEGVEVHTQVIWPILLDGAHPHANTTESSRIETMSRMARSIGIPENVRRRVGTILDDLNVSDRVGREVKFEETFLARRDRSIPISVPGLGEMEIADLVRRELGKRLEGDARPPSLFWELCKAEHEIKRAATKTALDHADVVMTHFYALDAVQHLAQNNDETRVEAWYQQYAELVSEMLDLVDDGTVILLSDHGMEDGLHGPEGKGTYGYAASTASLGLADGMAITDLHDALVDAIEQVDSSIEREPRDHEHDDMAERRQHLRDLGYM